MLYSQNIVIMNNSSTASVIDLRRKSSTSPMSNSFSSSKYSLSSYGSLFMPGRSKGFSFGTSPRNTFMPINLASPAAKYNIKGCVEINLQKKKGPSFGLSRQQSIEKTPLSYVNSNTNPGPGTYNSGQLYKSSSSIKIGTQNNQSVRIEFLNEKSINKNPGPGAYQHKVVKLKGGKLYTQSKRFQRQNKENQPGPGSYNLAQISDVTSKAPKITLKNHKY